MSVWTHIVQFFLENEIRTEFNRHDCDAWAPCAVLKRALQQCYCLQLVCHEWNVIVTRFLDARAMKRSSEDAIRSQLLHERPFVVSRQCSLGGRFRAFQSLEDDSGEHTLSIDDWPGCLTFSQRNLLPLLMTMEVQMDAERKERWSSKPPNEFVSMRTRETCMPG